MKIQHIQIYNIYLKYYIKGNLNIFIYIRKEKKALHYWVKFKGKEVSTRLTKQMQRWQKKENNKE